MTRIRMTTIAAGPSFQAAIGDELELPDALAAALVGAGAAVVVRVDPPAERRAVEVAVIAVPETAEAVPHRHKGRAR